MIHEAAVREDHALIESGPYRFVRHPVYAGYLACYSQRRCLDECRPVAALAGITPGDTHSSGLGGAVLGERFGQDYERYVRRTGRLVPRFWGQVGE